VLTCRSWDSGRPVGVGGCVGRGGGEADWPVMRVEEHSFEVRVAFVVDGSGGWFDGRGGGGGDVVVGACEALEAAACCSHIDLVLGSTGHEDSDDDGCAGGEGRAAGAGGGGCDDAGAIGAAGAGSAFHHPILNCRSMGCWEYFIEQTHGDANIEVQSRAGRSLAARILLSQLPHAAVNEKHTTTQAVHAQKLLDVDLSRCEICLTAANMADSSKIHRATTTAPVNIAVIK
jgi:hypothetical protein